MPAHVRRAGDRCGSNRAAVLSVIDFLESLSGLHGPEFSLSARNGSGGAIDAEERSPVRKPFCTLKQFEVPSIDSRPRVLVVAPLSGQYALLLRDVVSGLLPHHSVCITDWRNARGVAVEHGKFDFEDNAAYVLDFLRKLGPDVHVLAVCQSAVPALAATALLAAADESCQPRSLILMGGLIDTRINPTRIDRFARTSVFRKFQQAAITHVPPGFRGAGRQIYPAAVQRAGLLTYVARHIELRPDGIFAIRMRGDPALADPGVLERLLTLMDLPAELYLQNIKVVLQDHALPRGTMSWRGHSVEPEAISRTALMTVEGEHDDVSGPGQTRAAHDLCRAIPSRKRRHLLLPGIGHFGMYAGRSWFESVRPRVLDFIRSQS